MSLDTIDFGRVLTHLSGLLGRLRDSIENGSLKGQEDALRSLAEDPVYIAVSAFQFRSPVAPASHSTGLRAQADTLAEMIRGGRVPDAYRGSVENALYYVEKFVDGSSSAAWNVADCYFTIPVMAASATGKTPGLVFLRTTVRGPEAHALLDVGSLTRDRELLSTTEDYFGRIAGILLKTIYFTQFYPFNPLEGISGSSYSLYFDCQITEGKSMGAAVLAMFAVTYLQSVLGETAASAISPRCGTVVTGEVADDGTIRAVEDFDQKIRCVHEELGPEAKIVYPRGMSIPRDLRFNEDGLFPVGNAEELLAAVCCSRENPHALDEARTALFRLLTRRQKELLVPVLVEGIHSSVFDHISQGKSARLNPRLREGGIYTISMAYQQSLDLRLGLRPEEILPETGGVPAEKETELVLVILDGSVGMEYYWTPDNRVCLLTSVLFEIASRVGAERELMVGFLSHDGFYPLAAGESSANIEDMIQKLRREESLSTRGAFFRPTYEGSLKHYSSRLKRIYVVSNSKIPDERDISDVNVSSFTRLHLEPQQPSKPDDLVLFPDREKKRRLRSEVLARCFHKDEGRIVAVSIDFHDELPLLWAPEDGNLTRATDGYRLTWKTSPLSQVRTSIVMADERPAALGVETTVRGRGVEHNSRFVEYPMVSKMKRISTSVREGTLSEADFALWQNLCSRGDGCECGNPDFHLFHQPSILVRKSVFESIAGLSDGYVLHQEGSPKWAFFRTGYPAAGVRFVLCNGQLHSSVAKGELETLSETDGIYAVTAGKARYFAWKC